MDKAHCTAKPVNNTKFVSPGWVIITMLHKTVKNQFGHKTFKRTNL